MQVYGQLTSCLRALASLNQRKDQREGEERWIEEDARMDRRAGGRAGGRMDKSMDRRRGRVKLLFVVSAVIVKAAAAATAFVLFGFLERILIEQEV